MKKYIYLIIALMLSVFLVSCDDEVTGPGPIEDTGTIFISSAPAGAQIWIDNNNSGKVTPDSLLDVSTGTHSVALKLEDYEDTTFSVDVVKDLITTKFVQLTSALSLIKYGAVRIYETVGTTVNQPSGLDLSSGNAYGILSNNKDSIDLYYSSAGFVVRSAEDINSRVTSFYIGSGSDLEDSQNSPLATPAWLEEVPDTTSNYIFIFANDLHYSKLKIIDIGGGVPGDPAWIEVEWYYNTKANDVNF